MSTDFRALCAELAQQLDDALDFTVSSDTRRQMKSLVARARAELAESEGLSQPEGTEPSNEELSPREVEAQEAFTQMRDLILNLSDGLEVNEVLGIIDDHTPKWV
jgi:hypothetical protein